MFDHEIPSPIKEIMHLGGELVDRYVETVRNKNYVADIAQSSVVYIGKEYFLTFTGELGKSTSPEPEYKACIYCFPFSSEPMLIFSGETYYPKAKEFDATYWLGIVKDAQVAYHRALDIVGVIDSYVQRNVKS